jgi:cytochrome c oxidase cbb3-type subunit 2
MIDPRSVVPGSVMPGYPALAETDLAHEDMAAHLSTLRVVGVPFTDEQIEAAVADVFLQTHPDEDTEPLLARYPKAVVADFDGDPSRVTELDALIAYLQVLGTMVDFTTYKPEYAAAE